MDKENGWDASPSWNGYMYQGKVALLVSLRWLLQLKDDVKNYWLELEGVEDFSIGYCDKYISIHQVKNWKKVNLSGYGEAFSNMVRMIGKHPEIEKAFLHTSVAPKSDYLDKDICDLLEHNYPERIRELEKIHTDSDILKRAREDIIKKWNDKTKKFNKNTKLKYKLIIDSLNENLTITSGKELTVKMVDVVCKTILDDEKKKYDDINKREVVKKIAIYKYGEKICADSNEVFNMSLNKIKKYWGNMSTHYENKINIYYMKLLEEIHKNIVNRVESKSENKRVPLQKFVDVLNKAPSQICFDTREEKLTRLKWTFLKEKTDFCKDICSVENTCQSCSVNKIFNLIMQEPLNELEVIFRIMALHKTEDLMVQGFELFNTTELEDAFFLGLSRINRNFSMSDLKVVCRTVNNFMMLTTIAAKQKKRVEKTVKGLMENDIQYICQKIIKSDDVDTSLMEIDELCTADCDTVDIFREACKINDIKNNENDNLQYMKITNTKKVSLISVEKAIEKYGDRK